MKVIFVLAVAFTTFPLSVNAFSLDMLNHMTSAPAPSRRSFFSKVVTSVASFSSLPLLAEAASPAIYKLDSGVTYATLKEGKGSNPQPGDIVAIEYTGYLTSGIIFDGTHSEGKSNALLFKLGR
jgi:hypothetical protein